MKKIIFSLSLLLAVINYSYAQVAINNDGTAPDASAMLDVKSSDKGFLLPRIANVNMVTNPTAGLMVYDIYNQCLRSYNGASWSDCMGGVIPASPCGTGTSMTDIDGNSYPIVEIGSQCWMAENLKVTKYPNGTAIPLVNSNNTWGALPDTDVDDAYSYQSDDPNTIYGVMYTYAAVIADNWLNDNVNNQGVCPDGWHVPTSVEWDSLIVFLGGVSVAGGKLKEAGTAHWFSPNTGVNSVGFTALPAGFRRSSTGVFQLVGSYARFWTATEANSTKATDYYLDYNNSDAITSSVYKSLGSSVRCVKN